MVSAMTKGRSICNVMKAIRTQVDKAVTIVGILAGLSVLTGCGKDAEMIVTPEQLQETNNGSSDVLVCIDESQYMPSFPGGGQALMDFIKENIRYTELMEQTCVMGRVVVTFIVEKDGSITDAKVIRGIHPAFDKEALRVINSMPRWNPGMRNGEPVRVKYSVPVSFRLE